MNDVTSQLRMLPLRWGRFVGDTLPRWIAWKLPKGVVFWAFYRVIGAYGDGAVFHWPVERVAKDLEAWAWKP